jgi:2-oxoglutarate ferredoxin oxidoreductase subunit alpha
VHEFVASHDRIYVIEQNRDAQMLSLLKLDLAAEEIVKLRSIRHFNGLPIDARSVTDDLVTQEGI